ncbi:transmembrane protein 147 [Sarcophilus harrisii]|uniref:transmembrane protein 147 n=1 Tax=Sarcophilus harrisii TaxID=9305 RepID=UPI001301D4A9|nr:transmembrane protein 147 [Sarcophilus harrisii]
MRRLLEKRPVSQGRSGCVGESGRPGPGAGRRDPGLQDGSSRGLGAGLDAWLSWEIQDSSWVVSPNSKPWDFSISQEFMKATVDLGDLVGLHLVMSRNAGKGEYKVMVAALGWATAELIMSRCIPLWVGARGIEFDWKYIQMSIDSNISLVHYIAVSALVWMFTRYDLPRNFRPPLTLLLGISVYKAFILEAFVHLFSLGSWTALLVRAVMTGVLALSSLSLFVTLVHGN